MEVLTVVKHKNPKYNGGYVSIHDNGFACERVLHIIDDEGNMVKIKNEQIGELFNHIKPVMMG